MKTQTLVERHAQDIKGVIECFDRVVLFGTYKAIGWTGAMEQHLRGRGTSFMEFNKVYANQLRLKVADHVRTLAHAEDIEIRQVNAGEHKEAMVEEILAVRGRRAGVVCILGAIERCRCFKVGKNQKSHDWLERQMRTAGSLGAVAEAMSACNRRYLTGISQWRDRTRERHALGAVTASRRDEKDRSVRGVNFFRSDDLQFLRTLQRGEHQIQGVRNRTLQPHLPGWKPSRIGRTLRRFRVLKLIKPVEVTRKYYPTAHGESLVIAGLQLTERIILPAFAA